MNKLVHAEEFSELLSNYRVSSEGTKLLQNLRLVLLSGPSASGRNTIIERLLDKGEYKSIVSDTTRKPRVNNGIKEQNGVTYHFRGEEDFISDLKQGAFLEAEIIHNQQVSGISIRELKAVVDSTSIAITEVEIGGFLNILSRKPDTVGIFVLPPSFDEWLDRLHSRSRMPAQEVASRLTTGLRIFEEALSNHQARIVINDNLDKAVDEVDRLAHNRLAPSSTEGRKLAAKLRTSTKLYLKDPEAFA